MTSHKSQSRATVFPKRPSHLVLFKERCDKNSDQNVAALADILKIKERKGGGQSRVEFAPESPGRCPTLLLRRFAMASADLTSDEENRLRRHPTVRIVVPNLYRTIPGTMASASVMALNGSGPAPMESPSEDWHVERVGAFPFTGKGVKVAVLDTGLDSRHPDLNGQVAARKNFVLNESDEDEHGHGTACAALIAGVRKSPGPRYSVSPGAKLIIAKVLNKNGRGDDHAIIEGIEWAAQKGARIISMSLGSKRQPNDAFSPPYEQLASQLFSDGILLLAAAGNDSDRQQNIIGAVRNPAACPSICAVAAVDRNDVVANNSSGAVDPIGEVNFSAPGVMVFSASAGPIYRYTSGTSSATPIAAGVAALLLEQDPSLTAVQLKTLLESRARTRISSPAPLRTDYGAGVVHL